MPKEALILEYKSYFADDGPPLTTSVQHRITEIMSLVGKSGRQELITWHDQEITRLKVLLNVNGN